MFVMEETIIKLPRTVQYVERIENNSLSEEQRNLELRVRQILKEGFVISKVQNLEFKDHYRSNRYTSRKHQIISDSGSMSSSEDSGDCLPKKGKKNSIVKTTSLDNMKAVIDYFKRTKGGWRTRIAGARKRFKTIFKDCSTNNSLLNKLRRFELYVKNHGCRLDKMRKINEIVLERFKEAKEEYKIVEEIDIQDWAIEASGTVKLKNFKASQAWSNNFKIANRIVSRATNRIISPRFSIEEAALQNELNKFIDIADHENQFHPAVSIEDEAGFDNETHAERMSRSKEDTRIGEQNGETIKEEWDMGDTSNSSD